MSERTFEDVAKYVEWQSQNKCKVLSAKPEHVATGNEVKNPIIRKILTNLGSDNVFRPKKRQSISCLPLLAGIKEEWRKST